MSHASRLAAASHSSRLSIGISAEAALVNACQGGLPRARLAFQFGLPGVAIALLLVAGVALALGAEQAVWGADAVVFALITTGTQSAWDLPFSYAPDDGEAPDAGEPNRETPDGTRVEDRELAPEGQDRAREASWRKEVSHGRS